MTAGLLAAGHHVAGAAEHLAKPGEDLTQFGHVEIGPRIGILLAVIALGVFSEKPKGRSAIPSTVLMTGASRGRAGNAVSEPPRGASTVGCVNRRILTLLVALVPVVAFGVLLAAVTVPYVSLGPGPTFDTLGEVDGKAVVDIEGTDLHPTAGHLNMTTVSQRDDLTLGQALTLWMSGREQLVPRDLVYPPDKSKDEIDQANKDFKRSEDSAEYAALGYLKYRRR